MDLIISIWLSYSLISIELIDFVWLWPLRCGRVRLMVDLSFLYILRHSHYVSHTQSRVDMRQFSISHHFCTIYHCLHGHALVSSDFSPSSFHMSISYNYGLDQWPQSIVLVNRIILLYNPNFILVIDPVCFCSGCQKSNAPFSSHGPGPIVHFVSIVFYQFEITNLVKVCAPLQSQLLFYCEFNP